MPFAEAWDLAWATACAGVGAVTAARAGAAASADGEADRTAEVAAIDGAWFAEADGRNPRSVLANTVPSTAETQTNLLLKEFPHLFGRTR